MHVTLQDIAALMGGSAALYGVLRGLPIMADRLKLIRERDEALDRARVAEEAATAFESAARGWKLAVEQVGEEVASLRSELAASREEVHQSREEVRKARELLAQAIVYITSLHTFMRVGTNLPQMPPELRAEIDAILENREPLGSPAPS